MIDVTTTHFLECKEYELNPNGEVAYYLLRATPKDGEEHEVIRLKPHDLISYTKFKVALLNRRIFYSASRAEHSKNLAKLFEAPLCLLTHPSSGTPNGAPYVKRWTAL
jgi:hypothetical protein